MRSQGITAAGGPLHYGDPIDLPREPRESREAVRARMEAKTNWRDRSPFGPRTEREEEVDRFAPHTDPTYTELAFTTPPRRDELDDLLAAGDAAPVDETETQPEDAPAALAADQTPQGAGAPSGTPTGVGAPGAVEVEGAATAAHPRPAGTTPKPTPRLPSAPAPTAKPRRRSAPTPRPATRPAPQAAPRPRAASRPKPDAAAIVREYTEDRMTIPQIARKRGHSTRTARDLLKATPGVVMRDDRSTHSGGRNKIADDPRVVAAIRRLYVDEGLSQTEVAERLQLTYQVVRRVMRTNGIEARPPASVTGHGSARPGVSTLAKLRQAIEDAGLTARTLREWAIANGIDVPTTGLPGWDVLDAYLADRPVVTPPAARGSVRRAGNRWRATCSVCGHLDITAVSHAATLNALGSHLRIHQPAREASA
ncbi:helix-turn-helix domain-containing protein [Puerhibacterium puerhi]|uniref:helix-turn-helix domain-containing protein n=1 Tax=Puerhibacterium puerhi TaxID=2692623 RepID=UPI0013588EA0|nr:helix-turn-helix transcriptional regulator [Puerhibacterium puerhi]